MARNVRKRMIEGALELISRRGLQSTSFAEVTQATGTPRGSIYHHFPGGKAEMVAAALAEHELRRQNFIVSLPTDSPESLTKAYAAAWRNYLQENNFEASSAATAVAVAAEDESQLDEVRDVFDHALELLTAAYQRAGLSQEQAAEAASLALTTMEGATVVARTQRSLTWFDHAQNALVHAVKNL